MSNLVMVIEDEEALSLLLSYNLQKEGYQVATVNNGLNAVSEVERLLPSVIILDWMLPEISGVEICKLIRSKPDIKNIPIIMLTAKSQEEDKIKGLSAGADDYVTKPFSIRELIARIKANLRKAEASIAPNQATTGVQKKDNIIKVGVLTLDLDRFDVMVGNKSVDLTLREFEVLKFLASEPGQVVSREVLLEKVWGYEYYGDIRTVDVTVRRIREKIEKDTSDPKILMTKRSVGYYIAV